MMLHSSSFTVELIIHSPRDLAMLGAVEPAGYKRADGRGTQAGTLRETEDIALGEHGGRASGQWGSGRIP